MEELSPASLDFGLFEMCIRNISREGDAEKLYSLLNSKLEQSSSLAKRRRKEEETTVAAAAGNDAGGNDEAPQEELEQQHVDIPSLRFDGNSLLHFAAANNRADLLDILLKQVNENDEDAGFCDVNTTMDLLKKHVIRFDGQEDATKCSVIRRKFFPDLLIKNTQGKTPLHVAAENGAIEAFRALLLKGYLIPKDIHDQVMERTFDGEANNILHLAVQSERKEMVDEILSYKAFLIPEFLLAQNSRGMNGLVSVVSKRYYDSAIQILDQVKASSSPTTIESKWPRLFYCREGENIFHYALPTDNTEFLAKLVGFPSVPSLIIQPSHANVYPLQMIADRKQRYEQIKMIFDACRDHYQKSILASARNFRGETFLQLASAAGSPKVVKLLLEAKKSCKSLSWCDVVDAIVNGDVDCFQAVLKSYLDRSNDLDARLLEEEKFVTPLGCVAFSNSIAIMREMLSDDGQIKEKYNYHPTSDILARALQLAAEGGAEDCFRFLLEDGPCMYDKQLRTFLVLMKSKEGKNLLHFAASCRICPTNRPILDMILERRGLCQRAGFNGFLAVDSEEERSALHWAVYEQVAEGVIDSLLDHALPPISSSSNNNRSGGGGGGLRTTTTTKEGVLNGIQWMRDKNGMTALHLALMRNAHFRNRFVEEWGQRKVEVVAALLYRPEWRKVKEKMAQSQNGQATNGDDNAEREEKEIEEDDEKQWQGAEGEARKIFGRLDPNVGLEKAISCDFYDLEKVGGLTVIRFVESCVERRNERERTPF